MKLKSLQNFEKLNQQELPFIVGGAIAADTVCWEDSTSKDSKKHDKGGCSKKLDEAASLTPNSL